MIRVPAAPRGQGRRPFPPRLPAAACWPCGGWSFIVRTRARRVWDVGSWAERWMVPLMQDPPQRTAAASAGERLGAGLGWCASWRALDTPWARPALLKFLKSS